MKRIIYVYAIYILLMTGVMSRLFFIAANSDYSEAAKSQSKYSVQISRTRGTIYDCNMRPIAGGKALYRALICGGNSTASILEENLSEEQFGPIKEKLKYNYPFAVTVADGSLSQYGIEVFKSEQRYSSVFPAVHTVGYTDIDQTVGLSGIEKAFDEWLNEACGECKVTCEVDGAGRILSGGERNVTDTVENSRQGVVLTIDVDIQQIIEQVAEKYIEKGAVVLMEVPSGNLRAMASYPTFSPLNVAEAIDNTDSALVNRCLTSYDVGSVFKLVTAAAALDGGIPASRQYECTGSYIIGNNIFTCSGNKAHGLLDMEGGICYSCNLYFIQLANEIGADRLLATAQTLGFGESITLAPGFGCSSGNLPSAESLTQPATLANFSFGQGELMATPLQIARLTGTIACNGNDVIPTLIEKTVDKYGRTVEYFPKGTSKLSINESTAYTISACMRAAVLDGTAVPGKTDKVTSAAKTGTAETGIKENGKEVLQAWYAGYFPYEDPKYVCVVIVENGTGGGTTAGPIFKEIAEGISGFLN